MEEFNSFYFLEGPQKGGSSSGEAIEALSKTMAVSFENIAAIDTENILEQTRTAMEIY